MNDLTTIFPNASPDVIARNAHRADMDEDGLEGKAKGQTGSRRASAKLERPVKHAADAKALSKKRDTRRFFIRITSVRERLLDCDNLAIKWHLDLLRYSNIIPDDNPERVESQACQRKVGKEEQPHTVIEIYQVNS